MYTNIFYINPKPIDRKILKNAFVCLASLEIRGIRFYPHFSVKSDKPSLNINIDRNKSCEHLSNTNSIYFPMLMIFFFSYFNLG